MSVIITATCCAAPTVTTAPTVTGAWLPDKALLGRLAPAVTAGNYQIRPPKGYVLHSQSGPNGLHIDTWTGPAQPDGTNPYIMLGVITPPAGEQSNYTLNYFSTGMLKREKRDKGGWKQSLTEQGRVGGLTFMRTYWQGTDLTTKLVMSGFCYAAKENNSFIQLSSQGVTPSQKANLSLAEASALTFKSR